MAPQHFICATSQLRDSLTRDKALHFPIEIVREMVRCSTKSLFFRANRTNSLGADDFYKNRMELKEVPGVETQII